MKQDSNKEMRKKVEETFNKGLDELRIRESSKKVKRLINRAAKRIAKQLKSELKKDLKERSAGIRRAQI